ncbi:receptor-like protein 54 [Raphanus sativus]|uniref:Receptor-like protein 54 n=1 Tax=Raphanus sativus TaxID=3726 RepID=A0A6J0P544_RAPSA|nr:receptor-like protein 54 [Raphanus sativus]
MVKPCSHVSSNCSFFCCLFVSSFFVNSFFSLPFPRSEQIEFLLAFKNEFPILKCDFRDSKQKTNSWTSKDVESFDGVFFDYETGAVTKLDLRAACLSGTLSANSSLFRLHQLRYLDLSSNSFDSFSFLPELGKLTDLEVLHLSYMGLSGEIPSSFSSLNRLTELDLSNNEFVGSFSPLLNLSRLSYLYLSNNLFSGCVPCSLLTTMPFLSYLNLGENHFTDSVETLNCSSSSSSNLETLYLNYNHLSGRILEPLSKLTNLKKLYISYQNTTDPINFVSSGFKSLEELDLSGNAISRLNISYSNLKVLLLDNCGINEFPIFIKNQQKLQILYMENNRLKGEVPKWLWSKPSLYALLLSDNSLDSFEGSPVMLLNSSLNVLDLRSNAFRGSLPIISHVFMLVSNNSFTGDIPLSLCDESYLEILDLSHNNFSGSIPRCLSNSSIKYLDLRHNNLTGRLPDLFNNSGSLITLDVSHNQITGKLPRSLTNCTNLEYLNVESNRIADTFPFWMKDLPRLQVIVLRSNMFHGPINSPQQPVSFMQLRIVDISRNQFTGSLPHDYFVNWSTPLISIPPMERKLLYVGVDYSSTYHPSMYLRNKGINMELEKILEAYTIIDLSENKLGGHIPESIGLLKSLVVLNLSNNDFTGHIPSSWANLTRLESLDLSRNQLTGKIPQELATLSFLEYIDVSHNNLTGQIPQGTQFGGQPKSSFEGNLNLCGRPLDHSCFRDKAPEAQESEPSKQEQVLNWKAAAMGYGPGVLFGLAVGQVIYSYKPVLFYKLFRL